MNLLCYLLPMAILQLGLPAAATSSVCEQPNPSACQAEINHVTASPSLQNYPYLGGEAHHEQHQRRDTTTTYPLLPGTLVIKPTFTVITRVQPIITTTSTVLWHIHETTTRTKTKTKTHKTGRRKGTATITTVSTETTTTTAALETTTTTESETTTTTALDTTTTTERETTTTTALDTTTTTAYATTTTAFATTTVSANAPVITDDMELDSITVPVDDAAVIDGAATTDATGSTNNDVITENAATNEAVTDDTTSTGDSAPIDDSVSTDIAVTEDAATGDDFMVSDIDASNASLLVTDPSDTPVTEDIPNPDDIEFEFDPRLGPEVKAIERRDARAPYPEELDSVDNKKAQPIHVHGAPEASATEESEIPHPPAGPNHSAFAERQKAAAARAPYPWESDPIDYKEGERVDIQGAPETSSDDVENSKPKASSPKPKHPSDALKDRHGHSTHYSQDDYDEEPRSDWSRPSATTPPRPMRPYPPYPHHPPAEVMFPMWEPEWVKYDSDDFVLEEDIDTMKRDLESEGPGDDVYEAVSSVAVGNLEKRGFKIKNAEEYLDKTEKQTDAKAWDNNGPMAFSSDLLGMSPPGSLVKDASKTRKPKKDKKRKKTRFNNGEQP